MMPTERPAFPLFAFLALYLPAGALALGMGLLTAPRAPVLASVIQLAAGTAAFALAVEGAAEWRLRRPGGALLIERILHLRRNRLRYALGFGLIGAALAGAADISAHILGIAIAFSAGPGLTGLAAAFLFALAWIIIGSAGGRQPLLRRALTEALAGRRS